MTGSWVGWWVTAHPYPEACISAEGGSQGLATWEGARLTVDKASPEWWVLPVTPTRGPALPAPGSCQQHPLFLCHMCGGFRVFSNESALHIRWPKYWSFSFNNEYPGLISFRKDWWISLQSKGLSRVFSNTTVQKHQFFGAQLSL